MFWIRELEIEQRVNLLVKFSGTFLMMLGTYMVVPFMSSYLLRTTDISLALLGTILALTPLGSIIGTVLGGSWADRYGRKRIMIIGLSCTSIVYLSYSLAGHIFIYAILLFSQGFFLRMVTPAANAMLAESIPVEFRTRVYATDRVFFNTGLLLGPVLGSSLLIKFPTITFILVAISLILYAAATFIWIEDLGFNELKKETKDRVPGGYKLVLSDYKFVIFTFGIMFMAIPNFMLETMLPVYLMDKFNENGLSFYTILLVINSLCVLIFQVLITKLSSRFGAIKCLVIGNLLYATSLVGISFISGKSMIYLFFLIFVLGELIIAPYIVSVVAKISVANLRARYMGINFMQWMVGALLSSVIGGFLYEHLGGRGMLLGYALTALVACVCFLAFGKLAVDRLAENQKIEEEKVKANVNI